MADPLYELLLPHLTGNNDTPSPRDPITHAYLERLSTLSLKSLATTEDVSLKHADQTVTRSLQALSKRSHSSITTASDHLKHLPSLLSSVRTESSTIKSSLAALESSSSSFAQKYARTTSNPVLDRRKTAALLNANYERIGAILELPSLLSSTITPASSSSTSSSTAAAIGSSSAALTGYASALDLHAHVKRLSALYPTSPLVASVATQADAEIAAMTTALLTTLQSPGLKLAVAMRTVGWLRRVAPADLGHDGDAQLGAVFLVCRLVTLRRLLEALAPLRQLADVETPDTSSPGVQSERYLKRFVELFREQSFAIVSMYRSIFPAELPVPVPLDPSPSSSSQQPPSHEGKEHDVDGPAAPALASLVPALVELLVDNLARYLPNVRARAARDSLLSQVLFCAGSLGRLGADFGMVLALLEDSAAVAGGEEDGESEGEQEWAEAMKKHRVQASRLEVLASGVRKTSYTGASGGGGGGEVKVGG